MSKPYQTSDYNHPLPDLNRPFDIVCPSNTDLWRSPPDTDRANTPFIYRLFRVPEFKSAKVTVSGPWTQLYDQGGLCVVVSIPGAQQTKWVKSGIEMMDGKPRVSCVATDAWSDWSLHPVVVADKVSATIEFVVKHEGKLCVLLHGDDGECYPMREITWWRTLPEDAELKIGVAAARPAKEGGELKVHYENLSINT